MMPGKWNVKWSVNVIYLNLPLLLFPHPSHYSAKAKQQQYTAGIFLNLKGSIIISTFWWLFFFFKFQHSLKLFPCCQATAVLKSSGYLLSRRNFLHESPDTRLHASIHGVCHEKPVFNLHKEMIQLKFYCKYGVTQKTHLLERKVLQRHETWYG